MKKGKLEEAVFCYRDSLREQPNAAVHNDLAVVLMRLGRVDEAARELRRAIAMDPGNVEALRNLGAIQASQGRVKGGRGG